jgi:hypothetical protein
MPSEVIKDCRYDPHTRTLFVTFPSGDLYAYADVAPHTWTAFCRAMSKGRFFTEHIRDRHAYGKVEDLAAVRMTPPKR